MNQTIKSITTIEKFEKEIEMWATLNVWDMGPLLDLEDDDEVVCKAVFVNGQAVAYLIADGPYLWHIETREAFRGNGYAKQLLSSTDIDFAWSVCSDGGAGLMQSVGIDFEDIRDEE